MKAYISIPMTGHDLTVQEKTAREVASLVEERLGMETVTPFDVVDNPLTISYAKAMGMDIEVLLGCDVIVGVEGWNESRGCRDEMFIALNHHIRALTAKKDKNDLWSLQWLSSMDISINVKNKTNGN